MEGCRQIAHYAVAIHRSEWSKKKGGHAGKMSNSHVKKGSVLSFKGLESLKLFAVRPLCYKGRESMKERLSVCRKATFISLTN